MALNLVEAPHHSRPPLVRIDQPTIEIQIPPREETPMVKPEHYHPMLMSRDEYLAIQSCAIQDEIIHALMIRIYAEKPFKPAERAAYDASLKPFIDKMNELRPDFEDAPLTKFEVLQFELFDRIAREPNEIKRKGFINRSVSLMDPSLRIDADELVVAVRVEAFTRLNDVPYGPVRREIGGYKMARMDKYLSLKRALAELGMPPLYTSDQRHGIERYSGEKPGSELSPGDIAQLQKSLA